MGPAWDSAVQAGDFPYPWSREFLLDIETWEIELGWRALEADVWENDALLGDRRIAGHTINWRETLNPCRVCAGTGRCPTCAGTGKAA